VAERRCAELAAGIHDEHLLRRDRLDREPLHVGLVVEVDVDVQILARRRGEERERVAEEPQVRQRGTQPLTNVLRKPRRAAAR
jgi:hypothetical protein